MIFQVFIKVYFIFVITLCIVMTSCKTTAHLNKNHQIRRSGFQQTLYGCRPIKGIILGLDIPYEFENLHFEEDTLSGTIMLITAKNPDDDRLGKWPSKPLRIYNLDTVTCLHDYIGSSDSQGKFKVKVNRNFNVVAFSNTNIDTCCRYLNCIIIDQKAN